MSNTCLSFLNITCYTTMNPREYVFDMIHSTFVICRLNALIYKFFERVDKKVVSFDNVKKYNIFFLVKNLICYLLRLATLEL